MAGMSYYVARKYAGCTFLGESFPSIPQVGIALFTGDPLNDYTGPEVVNSNNYSRVLQYCNSSTWEWKSASEKIIWNKGSFAFPIPTGSGWGLVTHFGVLDSITWGAGNLLYKGPLVYTRTIVAGDTFALGPHMLQITVDRDF